MLVSPEVVDHDRLQLGLGHRHAIDARAHLVPHLLDHVARESVGRDRRRWPSVPTDGLRAHPADAIEGVDLLLERSGDELLDLLGRGPRPGR